MTLKALSNVVYNLTNELNIPVTKTSIFMELEKHPQQFSLLAINDVLNTFQINNVACQVEIGDLNNDLCPFISHISRNEGEFVLVKQIVANIVIISSENAKKEILSLEIFNKYFTGSILVADDERVVEESDYKRKKQKEMIDKFRKPFLLSSLLMIVLLYVIQNWTYLASFLVQIALWQFFKIAGFLVSILLLIQNLDANNGFISKICKQGKKTDCNTILSSSASRIIEGLSWSELGFFYFSSTTFILLFYSNSNSVIQILAIMTLCCLPYTVYSLYYQSVIAKKWCILCVTIQALFWSEFFISFHVLLLPLNMPSLYEVWGMLILFILPVTTWVFLKPLLLSSQHSLSIKNQLNTFKRNADLFNSVLVSKGESNVPGDGFSVVIGSRDPQKTIIIASNPTCLPCAKTHKILDKWLNGDAHLQIRVVYLLSGENREGIGYKVARQITALSITQSDLLSDALHEWYNGNQMDADSWIAKYPAENIDEAEKLLDKQAEWCSHMKITHTPTIFINGYRLPEPYHLEDIKYLI